MSHVTLTARGRQPGAYRLPFGAHKGRRLDEAPVDYLAALRKADWLWPATRKALCAYLAHLARDPGQARLPFGKHAGLTLGDVDSSYLDWALGNDWIYNYPAVSWLLAAEIRRRCGKVLVYVDPLGPPVGSIDRLHEIEDREPFESKGFIPSEQLSGAPGIRGWRSLVRRPYLAAQADDERINQDMGLPPMPVLLARRERNRVYWASTEKGPVVKGRDRCSGDRLRLWDRALEALDAVGGAQDVDDLQALCSRADQLVRLLALSEGWDEDSNTLLDELQAACARRRDQLERQETTTTDADHRVEASDGGEEEGAPRRKKKGRPRGTALVDLEPARVHEVVRRLRSCRSEADLHFEASWVARHKDEFSADALACLRRWYAYFKAQLTA
jgi:uncharacterized protein (DUF3820 family)